MAADSARPAGIWIKICGVRSAAQAQLVMDAGADAIGLNFVPGSRRFVTAAEAAQIVRAVGHRVEWVGVFANQGPEEIGAIAREAQLDRIQLHGDEPAGLIEQLGPRAYKALRVATAEDLAEERHYGGDRLLLDSKVLGELGGTGHRFDWRLALELARRRPLVVAGGLSEQNVAEAIRVLRPFGVDTASGVESSPGVKDAERTVQFVQRARAAQAEVAGAPGAG